MSMVQGEQNVEFLKKRHETMTKNPLFQGMEFSDDPETLKKWIPLIMQDRPANEAIAATKMDIGTDVNFGALTRMIFDNLKTQNVDINYKHSVEGIKRTKDGSWELKVNDIDGCKMEYHKAKFVFLGAGGGSLELLKKQVFLKVNTLVDSRSADYSWYVKTKKLLSNIMQKYTEKLKLVLRQCLFRILTHDILITKNRCYLDRLLGSHLSS